MFEGWLEEEGINKDQEEMGENINDVISYKEIKKVEVHEFF